MVFYIMVFGLLGNSNKNASLANWDPKIENWESKCIFPVVVGVGGSGKQREEGRALVIVSLNGYNKDI